MTRSVTGSQNCPPLYAPSGVVTPSGVAYIASPGGGRLLVIANWIPAACRRCTASTVRSVSVLSGVMSVPSMSDTSSRIGEATVGA